jgi:23S rRNA (guanosine2251-2'-O)-methyltransferase
VAKRKPRHPRGKPGPAGRRRAQASEAPLWLYGAHAVLAALANPRRRRLRLLATAEAAHRHADALAAADGTGPGLETLGRDDIARLLPEGAVHQGLALLVEPLPGTDLEAALAGGAAAAPGVRPVIVVLDQVTDPQNVGAVLRSAAAFGARAVLTTARHAPPESGALAKAASGALEAVAYIQVPNLARALADIKAAGFWCLGLAEAADRTLAEADPGGPLALVLGAEGPGLRRLTEESCDLVARLPTRGPVAALNVSNAAAVALYELLGRGAGASTA